ncbi:hypothetical protein [Methylocystis heyeri]|uniref:Uncharacterized protein n=1 Tax=Methylocystis heyeri TaxID=391905 RepID=A0A6B8KHX7_9HYPH|nr:hypothetical protein [Methylocystis heyeri]QGM46113.1 hypothetical protein H2LOC_010640 [Methylocystis heyeri]
MATSTKELDREATYVGPPFDTFSDVDTQSVTLALNIVIDYINQLATPAGVAALTQAQATNPADNTIGTVSGFLLAKAIAQAVAPRVLSFTTVGQTTFSLPATPTQPTSVVMVVNSIAYDYYSGAFTLAGSTLTWTGDFVLNPSTDSVFVRFI